MRSINCCARTIRWSALLGCVNSTDFSTARVRKTDRTPKIAIVNKPTAANNTAVFFTMCVYLSFKLSVPDNLKVELKTVRCGAQGSAGNALLVWWSCGAPRVLFPDCGVPRYGNLVRNGTSL